MHFSEPTFWICWTPFNQTHYVYNLFNVVLCAKMKFETYKIVYSNPFWISLQNKNIFTIPICRKWLSRLYTSLITSEEKKFLLRLPINLALLISDSLLNLFTIFLTYKISKIKRFFRLVEKNIIELKLVMDCVIELLKCNANIRW